MIAVCWKTCPFMIYQYWALFKKCKDVTNPYSFIYSTMYYTFSVLIRDAKFLELVPRLNKERKPIYRLSCWVSKISCSKHMYVSRSTRTRTIFLRPSTPGKCSWRTKYSGPVALFCQQHGNLVNDNRKWRKFWSMNGNGENERSWVCGDL